LKKFYNITGQIFGFLTILLFAFLFANTMFNFNIPANIMAVLDTIKLYATFVVCGLAGLELVAGKKILALLYLIILAFVVIFSFFPEIRDQIINIVTTL
jgi:hypothetical protein